MKSLYSRAYFHLYLSSPIFYIVSILGHEIVVAKTGRKKKKTLETSIQVYIVRVDIILFTGRTPIASIRT